LNGTRFLPLLMDAQNQRKQFEAYLKLLLERRVEGLIVVANWIFAGFQFLSDIEKNNVPVVVVDRDLTSSGIHSVLVDNEAGGYMAIRHLHSLGHTRIAVIRGPGELTDSEGRWAGIRRYAAEAGLALDPRFIRQLPDAVDPSSGFDGGIRLTTELIAARKGGRKGFTALVAFDDLTALGAVRAHRQAGLSVPDDCSVIGFDDVLPAAVSSPGITTIRQPMELMGEIAVSWVLEAIEAGETSDSKKPTAPRLRLLAPVLVERESTLRYKNFR
jgi:LacI family transcriptional regulator